MKIIVNSIIWSIIFVPSNSKELLRSDGILTLGVTDRNVNCVFLSNQLHGELLYKVLCHELCHVYIFSYGIYFLMEEEERLAEFISMFGKNIINDTNILLNQFQRKYNII